MKELLNRRLVQLDTQIIRCVKQLDILQQQTETKTRESYELNGAYKEIQRLLKEGEKDGS